MADSRLTVEIILLKDLADFTARFFAHPQGQETAPISRRRAEAWTHNPLAAPDDPVLLVCSDGAKVVGYFGLMPGQLVGSRGAAKVFYGSTVYVLPEYRNRLVVLQLLMTLHKLGLDLVYTGMSDTVFEVYRRVGYRETGPLRICAILVAKFDVINALLFKIDPRSRWRGLVAACGPVFSALVYRPVRTLYYRRVRRLAERALRGVAFREVQRVAPLAQPSLQSLRPRFARGPAVVNWMLAHPWVESGGAPSTPPYYFADFSEAFQYMALQFGSAGREYSGYVVFSVRKSPAGRLVKVTDYEWLSEQDAITAFWLVMTYAAKYGADQVEAPDCMTAAAMRSPLASQLVRPFMRRYLYRAQAGGPLEQAIGEVELAVADTDCAFT